MSASCAVSARHSSSSPSTSISVCRSVATRGPVFDLLAEDFEARRWRRSPRDRAACTRSSALMAPLAGCRAAPRRARRACGRSRASRPVVGNDREFALERLGQTLVVAPLLLELGDSADASDFSGRPRRECRDSARWRLGVVERSASSLASRSATSSLLLRCSRARPAGARSPSPAPRRRALRRRRRA